MMQLGSILHSQGFSVKVAHTEYNAPNYSNHPEFVFHSMDDGLQEIDLSSPSLKNMYDLNENCKASFKNYLVKMTEEEESLQDSQLLDPLPELHSLRFKDVPFPVFNNAVPEPILDFCRAISVIGSSVDYLEHNATLGGFIVVKPSRTLQGALLSNRPSSQNDAYAPNSVLYVSLGSLARIDDTELIEIAWGLANSGQPFLWVIRPGSVSGFQCAEALPDGFEKMVGERGRIVKWAPQKQVLAHPR
ncbi:hypothetical protein P3S67_021411 [Capsicum chacoense]